MFTVWLFTPTVVACKQARREWRDRGSKIDCEKERKGKKMKTYREKETKIKGKSESF